jgi:hypothetical protein
LVLAKILFKCPERRQNPEVLTSSIKTDSIESWISLLPILIALDGQGSGVLNWGEQITFLKSERKWTDLSCVLPETSVKKSQMPF